NTQTTASAKAPRERMAVTAQFVVLGPAGRSPGCVSRDMDWGVAAFDTVDCVENRRMDDCGHASRRRPRGVGHEQRALEYGVPFEYVVSAGEEGNEDTRSKNDSKSRP